MDLSRTELLWKWEAVCIEGGRWGTFEFFASQRIFRPRRKMLNVRFDFREEVMREPVVLDDVKASEVPRAWRRRVKAKGDERLTVTISRRAGKGRGKPNATFGMWADRADIPDP